MFSNKSKIQEINSYDVVPMDTSDDYGEEGWMSFDDEFHYIYVNGKWLRQPIAHFEF